MGMRKCPLCKKEYNENDTICPICFAGNSQEEKKKLAEVLSIPDITKILSMTPSDVLQLLDDEDDKQVARKEMKGEPKEFLDKMSPRFKKIMSLIREIPTEPEEAIIFDDYFHGSRLGQPDRVIRALKSLNYYFPNERAIWEELKQLNLNRQKGESKKSPKAGVLEPRSRSRLLGKIFKLLKDNKGKAFTVKALNKKVENILEDLDEIQYCKKNLQKLLNEMISDGWIKSTQHGGEIHYFF